MTQHCQAKQAAPGRRNDLSITTVVIEEPDQAPRATPHVVQIHSTQALYHHLRSGSATAWHGISFKVLQSR